uniref:Uncharacterized protein n=1 Tax=Amphimedon queenslandica TaxID=400682 RepID=A0A1X7VU13_AMPQE
MFSSDSWRLFARVVKRRSSVLTFPLDILRLENHSKLHRDCFQSLHCSEGEAEEVFADTDLQSTGLSYSLPSSY